MDSSTLISQIEETKLVPVVKLDCVKDAVPLGRALYEAGLPIAEITFRTEAAYECIKAIKNAFPKMIVGAGTVVNVEQAKQAQDAGSSFIVSPGFSRSVVEFAIKNNILILPGICTPTEIMTAMDYNLKIVKFFPAEQYGGLEMLKTLAAPFPSIRFMPTGGISVSNILKYLAFSKIIACGGSWMVKDTLIQKGNFSEISRLTAEAVSLIK